jgi:tetratricopeptide (TPR) repeat protein
VTDRGGALTQEEVSMIQPRAEENFRNGIRLLESRRAREAAAHLRAAMDADDPARPQARYLSYYGLALCFTRSGRREALKHCRSAVGLEGHRPALWWNLGRVALSLGRRSEAYRAWQQGLSLQPDHAGMRKDLQRLGNRRQPVLSFLPRSHSINVMLGKLRTRGDSASPKPTSSAPAANAKPAAAALGSQPEVADIVGIRVIG